jgi:hypothetical protein
MDHMTCRSSSSEAQNQHEKYHLNIAARGRPTLVEQNWHPAVFVRRCGLLSANSPKLKKIYHQLVLLIEEHLWKRETALILERCNNIHVQQQQYACITSLKGDPIIWSPTGRPADPPSTNPQGTTNAGSPAKLTFTCISHQIAQHSLRFTDMVTLTPQMTMNRILLPRSSFTNKPN